MKCSLMPFWAVLTPEEGAIIQTKLNPKGPFP
jgi:hypothetical protein